MFSRLRRKETLSQSSKVSTSCPSISSPGTEETSSNVSQDSTASSESDGEDIQKASRSQRLFAKKSIRRQRRREKDFEKKIKENKITMEDYLSKQEEFKLWLTEEKKKNVSEIKSPKAKIYFKAFVKMWNKRKLPQKYYRGTLSCETPPNQPGPGRQRFSFVPSLDESPFPNSVCFPQTIDLSHEGSLLSDSPFSTFGKSPGTSTVPVVNKTPGSGHDLLDLKRKAIFNNMGKENVDGSMYSDQSNLSSCPSQSDRSRKSGSSGSRSSGSSSSCPDSPKSAKSKKEGEDNLYKVTVLSWTSKGELQVRPSSASPHHPDTQGQEVNPDILAQHITSSAYSSIDDHNVSIPYKEVHDAMMDDDDPTYCLVGPPDPTYISPYNANKETKTDPIQEDAVFIQNSGNETKSNSGSLEDLYAVPMKKKKKSQDTSGKTSSNLFPMSGNTESNSCQPPNNPSDYSSTIPPYPQGHGISDERTSDRKDSSVSGCHADMDKLSDIVSSGSDFSLTSGSSSESLNQHLLVPGQEGLGKASSAPELSTISESEVTKADFTNVTNMNMTTFNNSCLDAANISRVTNMNMTTFNNSCLDATNISRVTNHSYVDMTQWTKKSQERRTGNETLMNTTEDIINVRMDLQKLTAQSYRDPRLEDFKVASSSTPDPAVKHRKVNQLHHQMMSPLETSGKQKQQDLLQQSGRFVHQHFTTFRQANDPLSSKQTNKPLTNLSTIDQSATNQEKKTLTDLMTFNQPSTNFTTFKQTNDPLTIKQSYDPSTNFSTINQVKEFSTFKQAKDPSTNFTTFKQKQTETNQDPSRRSPKRAFSEPTKGESSSEKKLRRTPRSSLPTPPPPPPPRQRKPNQGAFHPTSSCRPSGNPQDISQQTQRPGSSTIRAEPIGNIVNQQNQRQQIGSGTSTIREQPIGNIVIDSKDNQEHRKYPPPSSNIIPGRTCPTTTNVQMKENSGTASTDQQKDIAGKCMDDQRGNKTNTRPAGRCMDDHTGNKPASLPGTPDIIVTSPLSDSWPTPPPPDSSLTPNPDPRDTRTPGADIWPTPPTPYDFVEDYSSVTNGNTPDPCLLWPTPPQNLLIPGSDLTNLTTPDSVFEASRTWPTPPSPLDTAALVAPPPPAILGKASTTHSPLETGNPPAPPTSLLGKTWPTPPSPLDSVKTLPTSVVQKVESDEEIPQLVPADFIVSGKSETKAPVLKLTDLKQPALDVGRDDRDTCLDVKQSTSDDRTEDKGSSLDVKQSVFLDDGREDKGTCLDTDDKMNSLTAQGTCLNTDDNMSSMTTKGSSLTSDNSKKSSLSHSVLEETTTNLNCGVPEESDNNTISTTSQNVSVDKGSCSNIDNNFESTVQKIPVDDKHPHPYPTTHPGNTKVLASKSENINLPTSDSKPTKTSEKFSVDDKENRRRETHGEKSSKPSKETKKMMDKDTKAEKDSKDITKMMEKDTEIQKDSKEMKKVKEKGTKTEKMSKGKTTEKDKKTDSKHMTERQMSTASIERFETDIDSVVDSPQQSVEAETKTRLVLETVV